MSLTIWSLAQREGLMVGVDVAALALDAFSAGTGGEAMEVAAQGARATELLASAFKAAEVVSAADKANAAIHAADLIVSMTGSARETPCPFQTHPLDEKSPTYSDQSAQAEYQGLDVDHRYSQTAFPGLADKPWNLDLKPAIENRGPKALWEKNLIQYEQDLMQRTGWTRDEVRQRVTQAEWDSIANTVHPTYHGNMDNFMSE
jgi:hypothetical protein